MFPNSLLLTSREYISFKIEDFSIDSYNYYGIEKINYKNPLLLSNVGKCEIIFKDLSIKNIIKIESSLLYIE